MMSLSIRQPWLALIMEGRKTVEARDWTTPYRGPLLLAASRTPAQGCPYQRPDAPVGVALAVADLVDIVDTSAVSKRSREGRALLEQLAKEACMGSVAPYMWRLANVRHIKPFPFRGHLLLRPFKGHVEVAP